MEHGTIVKSSPEIVLQAGDQDNVCNALCDTLLTGVDIHRTLAAQALGQIGGDQAVDALIKGLLDEDGDVRTDAATALARLADPKADKQLLENLIGDPCPEVKLAAMDALAATANDEVKPWLLRILAGRDEEIVWDEDEFYATGWDDWVDMQVRSMQALADLGVEDAITGITAAINDDEALDITETAMKSLARIGDSGIKALADYMDDSDERRRRRAASVLSHCDGPVAANAVNRALQDASSAVRLAVAKGLAEKAPTDERLAVLLVDESPEIRAEAVVLCGAQHEERLDLLLDDKDIDVRLAVLDLLSKHPELTNTPMLGERLRDFLQSPSASIAASAAAAFAAVDPKGAIPELKQKLDQEETTPDIRRGIIRALRIVGDDDALQILTGFVDNEDRQVRLEAMSTIAVLAGEGDWPNAAGNILLDALSGELVPEPEAEPEEQQGGIKEDDVATAELDGDAEDQDEAPDEAPEANPFPTSTLDAITGAVESEDTLPLPDNVEMTQDDIEFLGLTGGDKKGRRTIAVVPDVLVHEDVCLFAARLLGDFSHPEVTVALLEPLSSNDNELKQTAADSLAHICATISELPAETLDALHAKAKSQNRDMRLQAVRALGCADDGSTVMILINKLDDEDSFVRTEAIRSLGRLGQAGPGVGRLLEDPDASVRLAAAKALAQTNAPGVVETLVDFATSFEGYHTLEAAKLLADIDKPAANTLFVNLLHDDDRIRYWKVAVESLGEINRAQPQVHV
ncbi:MAG: HEAT repeat domain-containing protein [Rhodospirillaceae bacterium]|nr:HEAT repeat domain-containing protein [Rhodospirillaceae bacterium]